MENAKNATPEPRRLDLLLDVPLNVDVELGRARMTIQDSRPRPGLVIELDKVAGEALDILVNDRLVAREAVVVNDSSASASRHREPARAHPAPALRPAAP